MLEALQTLRTLQCSNCRSKAWCFFGVSWDHAVDEASWNCRCQVGTCCFLSLLFLLFADFKTTICLDFKLDTISVQLDWSSFLLDLLVICKNGTHVLHGYRVQRIDRGPLHRRVRQDVMWPFQQANSCCRPSVAMTLPKKSTTNLFYIAQATKIRHWLHFPLLDEWTKIEESGCVSERFKFFSVKDIQ